MCSFCVWCSFAHLLMISFFSDLRAVRGVVLGVVPAVVVGGGVIICHVFRVCWL